MAAPLSKLCSQRNLNKCVIYSARYISSSNSSLQNAVTQNWSQAYTVSDSLVYETKRKIVLPKKIPRDEYTVLRAMAATVKKDYNAPHFKHMDDPFLIPHSSLEKRTYSLAKSSGKRAAQYVINNFPQYFEKSPMWNFEDKLPNVFYPNVGLQLPEASVEGLQERMDKRLPMAAYHSYQKMKDEGTDIPSPLVHDLLELLCVYNSQNPRDNFTPDETFFKRDIGQDNSKKIRKTWKDKGAAESLFRELEEVTARDYSSMIRGRAKYYQVDKAYELFKEMKEKGLEVDVVTYNAVLSIVSFLNEGPELRWDHQKKILAEMSACGITPDRVTFDNTLYVLTRASNHPDSPQWAMQVINEMKRCGIEPSLGSWYYVLRIVYNDRESQSSLLSEIVSYLSGLDSLPLYDTNDMEFFWCAMDKCNSLQNLELAYQIDTLLNKDNNIQFLGDGYKEGDYYTNFLELVCMFEQMDTIMDVYERITPHAYSPTFKSVDDVLKAIELNDGYKHLPKIWSDLILFDYSRRQDLMETLVAIMAKQKHEEKLQQTFVEITESLKRKYFDDQDDARVNRPLRISGPLVGNIAVVNLHAGSFDNAWDIFRIYTANKRKITGFPREDSLSSLAEACIHRRDLDKTMHVLDLMSDLAYPKLNDLIAKVKATFDLTEQQLMHLEDLW